ncbi:uncharacterized protein LOC109521862 [Hippocampus comes]|uniref:uncharacterized protein LOC109521862 n=1 Tax=Hippocampus comes TaxID=109280 RepID=UPI00094E853E|nr:PREDICTED: uncharacterized protein LOC109521862 [Hippocampus comes]
MLMLTETSQTYKNGYLKNLELDTGGTVVDWLAFPHLSITKTTYRSRLSHARLSPLMHIHLSKMTTKAYGPKSALNLWMETANRRLKQGQGDVSTAFTVLVTETDDSVATEEEIEEDATSDHTVRTKHSLLVLIPYYLTNRQLTVLTTHSEKVTNICKWLSSVACYPLEYATSNATWDCPSSCLVLKPQASPRGALLQHHHINTFSPVVLVLPE